MKFCSQVKKWIEEKVEQPVENWHQERRQRCRSRRRWWQRLFCWFVTYLVLVITYIIVYVTKFVIMFVCIVIQTFIDFIFAILGLLTVFIELIFSIPIIGALIKNILNTVLEIVWRLINNVLDIFLGVFDIEKKIRVVPVILMENGQKVVSDQYAEDRYQKARQILKTECNIVLIKAFCKPEKFEKNASKKILYHNCKDRGSFSFGVKGSIIESGIAVCKRFFDLIGYGPKIYLFFNKELNGCGGLGLTPTITKNYIIIGSSSQLESAAHQLGHINGLVFHSNDSMNLMFNGNINSNPTLSPLQRRTIRSSRFCVYL